MNMPITITLTLIILSLFSCSSEKKQNKEEVLDYKKEQAIFNARMNKLKERRYGKKTLNAQNTGEYIPLERRGIKNKKIVRQKIKKSGKKDIKKTEKYRYIANEDNNEDRNLKKKNPLKKNLNRENYDDINKEKRFKTSDLHNLSDTSKKNPENL